MSTANAFFNSQFYLSQNPDVAAAVAAGQVSAFEHFNLFGKFETRAPNPIFDTAFYISQNPDVAAQLSKTISAFDHFVAFGASEPRAIHPVVNLGDYLNANPDVAAAVAAGQVSAFEHLFSYGLGEPRSLGNGIDLASFANDTKFKAAIANGDFSTASARVAEVGPFIPTFKAPAGWTPPANLPIPLDFKPVAGEKLVIPEGVKVPEGTTLPDFIEPSKPKPVDPVEPVDPPVDPVDPPVDPVDPPVDPVDPPVDPVDPPVDPVDPGPDPVTPEVIVLTTGSDEFTGIAGRATTFTAADGTLQVTDRLDGGLGNNTLKASLKKGLSLENVISNIQNVDITAVEGTDDGTEFLNVGLKGVTNLVNLSSTNSLARLAFNEVGSLVALNAAGGDGKNIVLNYVESPAAALGEEQTVNLNGAIAGNITVQQIKADFSKVSTTLKTLSLNVAGDNTITRAGIYESGTGPTNSSAKIIKIAGSGDLVWKVLDGEVTDFDASASTGKLEVGVVAATVAQLANFDLGKAGVTTLVVRDNGDKDDATTDVNLSNLKFKNIDNVNVSHKGLTTLTIDGAIAKTDGAVNVTLDVASVALKTISLSGAVGTRISLDAEAAADTLTVNIGATAKADVSINGSNNKVDTFVFTEGFGDITINGFEFGAAKDQINLSAINTLVYADLTITPEEGNVDTFTITSSKFDGEITLVGVSGELIEGNFNFIA